jgi:hypothetical protein
VVTCELNESHKPCLCEKGVDPDIGYIVVMVGLTGKTIPLHLHE